MRKDNSVYVRVNSELKQSVTKDIKISKLVNLVMTEFARASKSGLSKEFIEHIESF